MLKKGNNVDKDSLNELIHLSKNLIKVFYVITIVGIVLGVLIALQKLELFSLFKGVIKVISPLFIGFIIAWLVNPLHRKLVNKGLNKYLSAILIFLGIIGIIILFVYIFIPVLYDQVNDLISTIPSILNSTTNFVTKSLDKLDISGLDMDSIKSGLVDTGQEMVVSFTSSLPNHIIGFVKHLFSAFGIIVLSLVVGIYMLIDFDNLSVEFRKLLPKKNRDDYVKLIENISSNSHRVVNGTLLIALMVFVCDTIGFALVGLDMAILFGLFCGLTDLIPYIGPYIGGAAAVIVGFTQGPIIGIGVLIIAIIVQILESYVLQPMVMSKAMQLPPVVIIIGLLLFGYFFNIIGMVVATPCMAIIKEIIMFINRKKVINKE